MVQEFSEFTLAKYMKSKTLKCIKIYPSDVSVLTKSSKISCFKMRIQKHVNFVHFLKIKLCEKYINNTSSGKINF